MFSNFIAALQGGVPVDEDEDGDRQPGGRPEQHRSPEERSAFNLWGVAEAVAKSVKETTNDFVTSVQETDWKSELSVFGKTVHQETVDLGVKTVRAVEALPEGGVNLPDLGTRGREVHQHLEGMGNSISKFSQGIVSTTRSVFQQAIDAIESEMDSTHKSGKKAAGKRGRSSILSPASKYSRMEAEVQAMQRDSSTYCEEPEDEEDFTNWKSTFDLIGHKGAIDELTSTNAFMAELQARIVPLIVEYDVFWTRYYYRLSKLESKHIQQKGLSERSSRMHEEEAQVSWDDDYEVNDIDDDNDGDAQVYKESLKPMPATSSRGQPLQKAQNQETVEEKDKELDKFLAGPSAVIERLGKMDVKDQSQAPKEGQPKLPVSTTSGQQSSRPQPLVDALATIPTISESSSGQTGSDGSPSVGERAAAESDTVEMASTSDGSGNREWCVVASPKDERAVGAASSQQAVATVVNEPIEEGDTSEDSPDVDGEEDGEEVDEDWGNWD